MSSSISAFVTGGGIVLMATLGSACARRDNTVPRDVSFDILLVTIDTLRADAVGAYARSRATPWIDRLAASGVRFDQARAHNVVTLPSHANILSGRLPQDHGVRDNAGFRFPTTIDTAATLLKARGYRTAAFVSAFPLESRFGLARGFDVYDDRFADAAPRPTFVVQERAGTETAKLARQWIDAAGANRWFCWVHLYEPHFPYAAPPPHAQRFADPYTAEVAAADAALAPLIGPILDAGDAGRTLVIVTADHGEALGDHGEATHGVFAYEGVLRVPLVMYQPRLFKPGVVSRGVGHVDLLPTILDALSLPSPAGLAGRSLLPAIAGTDAREAPPTYFEALSPSLNRRWAPLYGVVRDRTKYIELPIPELYDLQSDAREATNLAASQRQRAADMQRLLSGLRRSDAGVQPRAEDVETRERLRSLGYVASPTRRAARFTEQDDPKHLIGTDALLQDVTATYFAGDIGGALVKCRALVRRRPDTPLWLMHLALLERENGNIAAGIDALRRIVALSPDDSEALSLLGAYLTEAGRAREAADLLAPHTARADAALEVLTTRALALARLGQTRDALATLAAARDRDPSNAMTVVDIGTVHLMAGDRAAARRAFEDAIAINPQVARAHSSLGVLAVEDGRPAEAIDHWKAATSLDPREHEKILRMGIALARAGRTAEARACLQYFVDAAPPSRYRRDIDRARVWLKQSG
jgi:arylsulfatase A-like enzyme/Flp pilus assembly protein TadD